MKYSATKQPVPNRGICPDEVLDELITFGKSAPDEVFLPNAHSDIYSNVAGVLGPWTGLLHRKAAMLECLRVLGGLESSWNWNEGVDTTNASSMANILGQETGIFQVSADSMAFDPSLRACVVKYTGSDHAQVFIDEMKAQHPLAIEYCARLLRFSVAWDGPIKRGVLASIVRRDAVTEFQSLL